MKTECRKHLWNKEEVIVKPKIKMAPGSINIAYRNSITVEICANCGQIRNDIYSVPAMRLTQQGYRRISSKYKIISRIDRKDWIDFIYNKTFTHRDPGIMGAVKAYYKGVPLTDFGFMEETVRYEATMAANHYRRCYSKDKVENVDPEIFRLIPSSDDSVGYCSKE